MPYAIEATVKVRAGIQRRARSSVYAALLAPITPSCVGLIDEIRALPAIPRPRLMPEWARELVRANTADARRWYEADMPDDDEPTLH